MLGPNFFVLAIFFFTATFADCRLLAYGRVQWLYFVSVTVAKCTTSTIEVSWKSTTELQPAFISPD